MTYFPKTKIEFADSAAVDAFGRLRVSSPYSLFDNKQNIDDRTLFWSTKLTLGATASYSLNRASTTLTASTTAGSIAIRQSRSRANYQSGKSLLFNATAVFGPSVTGIRKRCGLFDDQNGIFLEQSGSFTNMVMRSSVSGTPIDQIISQSLWNVDKLNGSGSSGYILDLNKIQIFHVDLEWLGTGRVRTGFFLSGSVVYAHEWNSSNVSSSVYMSTPNLPVRYEVQNISSATTGTLEQICCTIASEGGYEALGTLRTIDRGITTLSGVTSVGLMPILSTRLKTGYTGSVVNFTFANVLCTSNATKGFRWALVLNPTLGQPDNASWLSTTSGSLEYDVSRNSTNILAGGIILASGYGTNSVDAAERKLESNFTLGSSIDGVTDQVVLAAQVIDSPILTEQFVGSLSWRELL